MKNAANTQFAVCIDNAGYEVSLELRKLYQVVPDDEAAKHHQLRVTDDSGEDYLYPESCFVPVTSKIPNAETIETLRQARSGEGLTEYANLESLKARHG